MARLIVGALIFLANSVTPWSGGILRAAEADKAQAAAKTEGAKYTAAEVNAVTDQAQELIEKGDVSGGAKKLREGLEAAKTYGEGGKRATAAFLERLAQLDHWREDFVSAAEKYHKAADIVRPLDAKEALRLSLAEADEYAAQGAALVDNGAVKQAIGAYRDILKNISRQSAPMDWANAQNGLAGALWILGERENNAERLKEAIGAYRAALEEFSRGQDQSYRLATQNNLGNALVQLGEIEDKTSYFEEAVAIFGASLKNASRDADPLNWAMTQDNLGRALTAWGSREEENGHLVEAIGAYRAALEARTRARAPQEWAATQSQLGNVLFLLGAREIDGGAYFEQAVAAYKAAMEERTRENAPSTWATMQLNLGQALMTYAQRAQKKEKLEEAIVCFRQALEIYQTHGPAQYAAKAKTRLEAAQDERAKMTK